MNTATVEIKVFSDDMLSALKGIDEDIIFDVNRLVDYKKEINVYFQNHLSIHTNGKENKLDLKTITQENDTHWIALEVGLSEDFTELTLETDMLTAIFPTQSNIVSISMEDNKEYYRLSKSNTRCLYKSSSN